MRTAVSLSVLLMCCKGQPPTPPGAPRPVVDLESWRVEADGQQLGRMVAREIRDPRGTVRYYHVENAESQWLGYLDEAGRLYRFEPFQPVERFLGVYNMAEGLSVLFGHRGHLDIVPEPDGAESAVREASVQKVERR